MPHLVRDDKDEDGGILGRLGDIRHGNNAVGKDRPGEVLDLNITIPLLVYNFRVWMGEKKKSDECGEGEWGQGDDKT